MAFRHIEAQAVPRSKTVPLVLWQLTGNPVLHVEHLGETNSEFWNDALAKANAGAFRGGKKKLTDALIKERRVKNRETVARYAVRALENVFHDDGKAATTADIRDVVYALPDDVFDFVLAFVEDANNFRDTEIDGSPDEIAKK